MHQRHQTGHVAEPEAGHQTGLERELCPQVQGLPHPDEVLWRGSAPRRRSPPVGGRWNDAVAQDLAQTHQKPRHRPWRDRWRLFGLYHEQRCTFERPSEAASRLGAARSRWDHRRRRGVVLPDDRDAHRHHTQLGQRSAPAGLAVPPRPPPTATRGPEPGSRCAHRRRRTRRRPPTGSAPADPSSPRGHCGSAESFRCPGIRRTPSRRRSPLARRTSNR